MTNQEAKNELIKRYKFLNEYASFILSPYIYEGVDSKIKFEMENRTPINCRESPKFSKYFDCCYLRISI